MTIHVVGLQRSGTNYHVELVRLNLTGSVLPSGDRALCWKHSLPDDQSQNASHTGLPVRDAVRQRPDVFFCLAAKHPAHWLSSLLKRTPADLYRQRPEVLDDERKPSIVRLMALYERFYTSWVRCLQTRERQQGGGFMVVRYEDTLHDPVATLSRLAMGNGLKEPECVHLPLLVPYNKPFDDARRESYLVGRTDLDERQLSLMDRHLPVGALDALGYQQTPPGWVSVGSAEIA